MRIAPYLLTLLILALLTPVIPLELYGQAGMQSFVESPESERDGARMSASVSVTQNESDYYYVFSWTGLNDDYCSCSQTTNIAAAMNSFESGSNWFYITGVGASSSSNRYVGPSRSQTLYVTIYYVGESPFISCLTPQACSTSLNALGAITGITAPIFAPSNVSATDEVYDNQIVITWTRETDIPTADHSYRIYRDGVLLTTVSGSSSSFTDSGLSPGQSYSYAVTTYTSLFGGHESSTNASGASDEGSTFSVGLVASDGEYTNRSKLSWNNLADVADEIRIERSLPGTNDKEELDILSGSAQAYNDQDGIPGYVYTYYVTPLNEGVPYLTDSDTGYSRPNGKISGHVRSQLNVGVSGVDIQVQLLDTIPAGGYPLPTCTRTYCTTTDIEGYYEIQDIYYYTGAQFQIVPFKEGLIPHDFTPDSLVRTLDETTKSVTGADFTDLTVFTIGGRVTYPESPNNVTCGVEGARVLVDDQDYGLLTDSDGYWTFAIQDEGEYSFRVEYLHHAFEDPDGDTMTTLFILSDSLNINFEDITTDDLLIVAQAGCEASLGDSVQIHVTAPGNCFDAYYVTDVNGILLLEDMPARDYQVEVTNVFDQGNPNISNIMDQIGNFPVDIDLTVRDTAENITATDTLLITPEVRDTLPNGAIIVTPADTTETTLYDTSYTDIAPMVRFIYRSPLVITTDWTESGATVSDCTNSEGDNIILMEQGQSYFVSFEVKELLGDCYIDTGYLKIYDFVSDREGDPILVPIKDGIASYQIDAGEPIVASSPSFHDHEKLFYVIPEVDLIEPDPLEYWVLVTGTKSNTPSFFTRTPDIPMLILHDPPGDGSYSYVEAGTSFTSFTTSEVLVGGDAGVYLNLLLGAKVLTPFSGNGFGTQIKFEASGGEDTYDREGVYTTITFTERFSTSDLENLTGYDGDVYIGAAFNQEFSLAQNLTFNPDSCKGLVDIIPSLAVEDFATTFVYTEKHIRSILLPTIGFIKDNIVDGRDFSALTFEEQAEVNNLIADSLLWVSILDKNAAARDTNAIFEENISFSAGAPLSREYSSDTTTTVSYEYNRFLNTDFALGAKIDNEAGIWFDSELGVMGSFRYASAVNEGNDTTMTRTVGYILDDNDIGDFFSVDILEDTSYSVPAFRLKLGTTSCPQEPGSQARDRASITIFPPELTNIPPGEPANFVTQITNLSESFETREYGVRVVATTNPDGMIVTLGGQWIGSGQGEFFLAPYQTSNMVLSFDQGPLASVYEDIGIMIYPTCEYLLWQDNGNLTNADTAWIHRIEWQSQCTDAALSLPDDGWLVNQQSNNTIHCALTGYDVNNPLFESISLQIKREGEGYVDQVTVSKEDLIGPFYDVFLDVSNFPDGDYRLRAKAFCGIEGGITYSSEKLGTIDRSSIAPFGTPTPADGFLREGQDVSVTFDKQLDCDFNNYPHTITLTREDTQADIPVTPACSGNQVILNTDPPLLQQLDLEGVVVTARVEGLQDLSGNVQEYPTVWSFLVNVSPVFWDPEDLHVTGQEGLENRFTATLKNTSLLSKAFSLATEDDAMITYPSWLTPVQSRGAVLPNNDYEVEFMVSDELTPGIYVGTVTAMVDDLPVSMEVTFELLANPVSWHFDPNAYQYSMTVVAQFSLDETNTNLSTDTRDLVGAFVNGQIRGITNIEYLPGQNLYRAFLTVYSNDQGGSNGEVISFRFWHALNGVEYGALETVVFTLDNTIGTVASPLILHPEGFFQMIPLAKGWNWISLNVTGPDMSRENIFQNLLNAPSNNSITIKSKTQTAQYSPGSGWNGNLQSLQLGPGYLVYLSNAPDTLRVVGFPSASTISVPIEGTWNWIGFPRLDPEPVNDVLAGLTSVNGDVLKSQYRFSAFDATLQEWVGNLNFFTPGAGYKLKATNSGVLFFDPSRSDGYETDPYAYEYNMNVTGFADLDMIGEREESDFLVGAFIDGECRGTGTIDYLPVPEAYRVTMLVNGNTTDFGKPVEFRLLNEATGAEYLSNGTPLTFIADGLIGSVAQPYEFFSLSTAVDSPEGLEGYHLESSRPNPARDHATISFSLPASEAVSLILYTAAGDLVDILADGTYPVGRNTIQVDLRSLPAGIYYYELRTASFSGVKRLVKE